MKIVDKNIETLQEIADIVFNKGFIFGEGFKFTRTFVDDELNYTPLYVTIYDIHRDYCCIKLEFEGRERYFEIIYSSDDEGTEERYKDMCNQLISNLIEFVVMENNGE